MKQKNMMGYYGNGYMMGGGNYLGFSLFAGINMVIWTVIGVLIIVWLWQHINKK